ncbi:MAG: efflux RND transporter periplasmic adaptor subunit [Chloroflexi bacterium]|nr:efflux RND transporter periplasmic adaptor subunit [Anaerolineaceae bacterium]NMB87997.1 efflux RND transporter periplasmic adaptor subunit [Chloroflexota bacterium]
MKARIHRNRWIWLGSGALVLLAIAGASIYFWLSRAAANAGQDGQAQVQTTMVRRGDMNVAIDGTGQLVALEAVDLSFPVSGEVTILNVQLGDRVKSGDVLAEIDGAEQLNIDLMTQQLELQSAQEELEKLLQNSDQVLAEAQEALAAAQSSYQEALKELRQKGVGRCSQQDTEEYYYQYLSAELEVNDWEQYLDGGSGYGLDYLISRLTPLRQERDKAYTNWKYCEAYTDEEIESSQANLALAQAEVNQAQKAYDDRKAAGGVYPEEIDLAEARVENARLQLELIQNDLDGLQIVAPMDGVVTYVGGAQGDTAGTDTFMTLVNLDEPAIQFAIDETDVPSVALGCDATVNFDAFPDTAYVGTVTELSPALDTGFGYTAARGVIKLQSGSTVADTSLPIGLGAAVEITCSQASNVLIVPTEALQQADDGSYYLYVLNDQGAQERREVVIGVQTVTYTEIQEGLEEGERVIVSGIENSGSLS